MTGHAAGDHGCARTEPAVSARLFYTTGEVCRRLGLPPHTLRYWERRLGMRLRRTAGGRRLFGVEDVSRLIRVAGLVKEGYALAAVRRRLREPSRMEVVREELTRILKLIR